MHPGPPNREEDLVEHVGMWMDKTRSPEAHGDEFKMAPTFKINAVRMLMTGKAKEYFDIWAAGRDTMGTSKSHEELLSKERGI